MFSNDKGQAKATRFTAFLTAAIFLCTNSVWAGPLEINRPAELSPVPKPFPQGIEIPEALGTLRTQYRFPEAKGFIVFIQDAHAVVDAQNNIASLIEDLQKRYGIGLVALEGGEGELDPTLFRTFPDEILKRKLMSDYLERAEITGAQWAAVFEPKEARYVGIEDWNLYEENYLAYLRAAQNQDELLKKLAEIRSGFDRERKSVFSPALNAFHEKVEAFEAERSHLFELLSYLVSSRSDTGWGRTSAVIASPASGGLSISDTEKYPHLGKLLHSLKQDSSLPKKQLSIAVKRLADDFRKQHLARLDKHGKMEFNRHTQAFVTGQMDLGEFLKYLVEAGKPLGVRPKLDPPMQALIGQVETLSTIQGTKLFDELKAFLAEAEQKLIQTPEERSLAERYQKLRFLKDLVRLELDRDRLDIYQKAPDSYLALLGDLSAREALRPALEFYRIVLERDHAFHENLSRLLKKNQSQTAIVLAGGFHSTGFEKSLRETGYSYAVVTPKIRSLEGKERYEAVMKGDLSYKKYLKTTFYDAFARHAAERLVSGMGQPDFKRNLKLWRDEVIRKLAAEGRTAQAGEYTRYIDTLLKIYHGKFGADSASRSKEEIQRELEKALENSADAAVDSLWSKFQIQFNSFVSGLRQLADRKEFTVGKVSRLLGEEEETRPATMAQFGAVSGMIRENRITRPEILEFFKTGQVPTAARPELQSLLSEGQAQDILREMAGRESIVPPMLQERAEIRDLSNQITGLAAKTRELGAEGRPLPSEAVRAEIRSEIQKIAEGLPPSVTEQIKTPSLQRAVATAVLEELNRSKSAASETPAPKNLTDAPAKSKGQSAGSASATDGRAEARTELFNEDGLIEASRIEQLEKEGLLLGKGGFRIALVAELIGRGASKSVVAKLPRFKKSRRWAGATSVNHQLRQLRQGNLVEKGLAAKTWRAQAPQVRVGGVPIAEREGVMVQEPGIVLTKLITWLIKNGREQEVETLLNQYAANINTLKQAGFLNADSRFDNYMIPTDRVVVPKEIDEFLEKFLFSKKASDLNLLLNDFDFLLAPEEVANGNEEEIEIFLRSLLKNMLWMPLFSLAKAAEENGKGPEIFWEMFRRALQKIDFLPASMTKKGGAFDYLKEEVKKGQTQSPFSGEVALAGTDAVQKVRNALFPARSEARRDEPGASGNVPTQAGWQQILAAGFLSALILGASLGPVQGETGKGRDNVNPAAASQTSDRKDTKLEGLRESIREMEEISEEKKETLLAQVGTKITSRWGLWRALKKIRNEGNDLPGEPQVPAAKKADAGKEPDSEQSTDAGSNDQITVINEKLDPIHRKLYDLETDLEEILEGLRNAPFTPISDKVTPLRNATDELAQKLEETRQSVNEAFDLARNQFKQRSRFGRFVSFKLKRLIKDHRELSVRMETIGDRLKEIGKTLSSLGERKSSVGDERAKEMKGGERQPKTHRKKTTGSQLSTPQRNEGQPRLAGPEKVSAQTQPQLVSGPSNEKRDEGPVPSMRLPSSDVVLAIAKDMQIRLRNIVEQPVSPRGSVASYLVLKALDQVITSLQESYKNKDRSWDKEKIRSLLREADELITRLDSIYNSDEEVAWRARGYVKGPKRIQVSEQEQPEPDVRSPFIPPYREDPRDPFEKMRHLILDSFYRLALKVPLILPSIQFKNAGVSIPSLKPKPAPSPEHSHPSALEVPFIPPSVQFKDAGIPIPFLEPMPVPSPEELIFRYMQELEHYIDELRRRLHPGTGALAWPEGLGGEGEGGVIIKKKFLDLDDETLDRLSKQLEQLRERLTSLAELIKNLPLGEEREAAERALGKAKRTLERLRKQIVVEEREEVVSLTEFMKELETLVDVLEQEIARILAEGPEVSDWTLDMARTLRETEPRFFDEVIELFVKDIPGIVLSAVVAALLFILVGFSSFIADTARRTQSSVSELTRRAVRSLSRPPQQSLPQPPAPAKQKALVSIPLPSSNIEAITGSFEYLTGLLEEIKQTANPQDGFAKLVDILEHAMGTSDKDEKWEAEAVKNFDSIREFDQKALNALFNKRADFKTHRRLYTKALQKDPLSDPEVVWVTQEAVDYEAWTKAEIEFERRFEGLIKERIAAASRFKGEEKFFDQVNEIRTDLAALRGERKVLWLNLSLLSDRLAHSQPSLAESIKEILDRAEKLESPARSEVRGTNEEAKWVTEAGQKYREWFSAEFPEVDPKDWGDVFSKKYGVGETDRAEALQVFNETLAAHPNVSYRKYVGNPEGFFSDPANLELLNSKLAIIDLRGNPKHPNVIRAARVVAAFEFLRTHPRSEVRADAGKRTGKEILEEIKQIGQQLQNYRKQAGLARYRARRLEEKADRSLEAVRAEGLQESSEAGRFMELSGKEDGLADMVELDFIPLAEKKLAELWKEFGEEAGQIHEEITGMEHDIASLKVLAEADRADWSSWGLEPSLDGLLGLTIHTIRKERELLNSHFGGGETPKETALNLIDYLEKKKGEKYDELLRLVSPPRSETRRIPGFDRFQESYDLYAILGVSKDTNVDVIKKAYRKLAMKYHPDRNSGKKVKEAEEMFKQVGSAYDILKDPEKRERYDREIYPNLDSRQTSSRDGEARREEEQRREQAERAQRAERERREWWRAEQERQARAEPAFSAGGAAWRSEVRMTEEEFFEQFPNRGYDQAEVPGGVTPWRFDGTRLIWVHTTDYLPVKVVREDGSVRWMIDTTLDATEGGKPLYTLHGSLNHRVQDHVFIRWGPMRYVLSVPLDELMDANPGRAIGGYQGDFYFSGPLFLPESAMVFTAAGKHDRYLRTHARERRGKWGPKDLDPDVAWSQALRERDKTLTASHHPYHWSGPWPNEIHEAIRSFFQDKEASRLPGIDLYGFIDEQAEDFQAERGAELRLLEPLEENRFKETLVALKRHVPAIYAANYLKMLPARVSRQEIESLRSAFRAGQMANQPESIRKIYELLLANGFPQDKPELAQTILDKMAANYEKVRDELSREVRRLIENLPLEVTTEDTAHLAKFVRDHYNAEKAIPHEDWVRVRSHVKPEVMARLYSKVMDLGLALNSNHNQTVLAFIERIANEFQTIRNQMNARVEAAVLRLQKDRPEITLEEVEKIQRFQIEELDSPGRLNLPHQVMASLFHQGYDESDLLAVIDVLKRKLSQGVSTLVKVYQADFSSEDHYLIFDRMVEGFGIGQYSLRDGTGKFEEVARTALSVRNREFILGLVDLSPRDDIERRISYFSLLILELKKPSSPPNPRSEARQKEGLCVTGDTRLPVIRKEEAKKNTEDSIVKEIPITDVRPGDYVLSLNEETGKIEPRRINALLDMGTKPVYRLRTASGRSIKTTANHPYLVKISTRHCEEFRPAGRNDEAISESGIASSSSSTRRCRGLAMTQESSRWIKVKELKVGDEIGVPLSVDFPPVVDARDVENILVSEELHPNVPETESVGRRRQIHEGFGKNHRVRSREKIGKLSSDLGHQTSRKSRQVLFGLARQDELVSHTARRENRPRAISRRARSYSRRIAALDSSLKGHRPSSLSMSPPTGFLEKYSSSESVSERTWSMRQRSSQKAYRSKRNQRGLFSESKATAARSLSGREIPPERDANLEKWPTFGFEGTGNFDSVRHLDLFRFPFMFGFFPSLEKLYHWIHRLSSIASVPTAYAGTTANRVSSQPDLLWDRIVSIEYVGREPVFDIEVDGTHNFIGNGIFAHNTAIPGSLPSSPRSEAREEKEEFKTSGKNVGKAAVAGMMLLSLCGAGCVTAGKKGPEIKGKAPRAERSESVKGPEMGLPPLKEGSSPEKVTGDELLRKLLDAQNRITNLRLRLPGEGEMKMKGRWSREKRTIERIRYKLEKEGLTPEEIERRLDELKRSIDEAEKEVERLLEERAKNPARTLDRLEKAINLLDEIERLEIEIRDRGGETPVSVSRLLEKIQNGLDQLKEELKGAREPSLEDEERLVEEMPEEEFELPLVPEPEPIEEVTPSESFEVPEEAPEVKVPEKEETLPEELVEEFQELEELEEAKASDETKRQKADEKKSAPLTKDTEPAKTEAGELPELTEEPEETVVKPVSPPAPEETPESFLEKQEIEKAEAKREELLQRVNGLRQRLRQAVLNRGSESAEEVPPLEDTERLLPPPAEPTPSRQDSPSPITEITRTVERIVDSVADLPGLERDLEELEKLIKELESRYPKLPPAEKERLTRRVLDSLRKIEEEFKPGRPSPEVKISEKEAVKPISLRKLVDELRKASESPEEKVRTDEPELTIRYEPKAGEKPEVEPSSVERPETLVSNLLSEILALIAAGLLATLAVGAGAILLYLAGAILITAVRVLFDSVSETYRRLVTFLQNLAHRLNVLAQRLTFPLFASLMWVRTGGLQRFLQRVWRLIRPIYDRDEFRDALRDFETLYWAPHNFQWEDAQSLLRFLRRERIDGVPAISTITRGAYKNLARYANGLSLRVQRNQSMGPDEIWRAGYDLLDLARQHRRYLESLRYAAARLRADRDPSLRPDILRTLDQIHSDWLIPLYRSYRNLDSIHERRPDLMLGSHLPDIAVEFDAIGRLEETLRSEARKQGNQKRELEKSRSAKWKQVKIKESVTGPGPEKPKSQKWSLAAGLGLFATAVLMLAGLALSPGDLPRAPPAGLSPVAIKPAVLVKKPEITASAQPTPSPWNQERVRTKTIDLAEDLGQGLGSNHPLTPYVHWLLQEMGDPRRPIPLFIRPGEGSVLSIEIRNGKKNFVINEDVWPRILQAAGEGPEAKLFLESYLLKEAAVALAIDTLEPKIRAFREHLVDELSRFRGALRDPVLLDSLREDPEMVEIARHLAAIQVHYEFVSYEPYFAHLSRHKPLLRAFRDRVARMPKAQRVRIEPSVALTLRLLDLYRRDPSGAFVKPGIYEIHQRHSAEMERRSEPVAFALKLLRGRGDELDFLLDPRYFDPDLISKIPQSNFPSVPSELQLPSAAEAVQSKPRSEMRSGLTYPKKDSEDEKALNEMRDRLNQQQRDPWEQKKGREVFQSLLNQIVEILTPHLQKTLRSPTEMETLRRFAFQLIQFPGSLEMLGELVRRMREQPRNTRSFIKKQNLEDEAFEAEIDLYFQKKKSLDKLSTQALFFIVGGMDRRLATNLISSMAKVELEKSEAVLTALRDAVDRVSELSRWDFVNRFPGANGVILFRGAKETERYEAGQSVILDNAYFTDKQKYAEGFIDPGGALVTAHVPLASIRHTYWVIPPLLSKEPEFRISGTALIQSVSPRAETREDESQNAVHAVKAFAGQMAEQLREPTAKLQVAIQKLSQTMGETRTEVPASEVTAPLNQILKISHELNSLFRGWIHEKGNEPEGTEMYLFMRAVTGRAKATREYDFMQWLTRLGFAEMPGLTGKLTRNHFNILVDTVGLIENARQLVERYAASKNETKFILGNDGKPVQIDFHVTLGLPRSEARKIQEVLGKAYEKTFEGSRFGDRNGDARREVLMKQEGKERAEALDTELAEARQSGKGLLEMLEKEDLLLDNSGTYWRFDGQFINALDDKGEEAGIVHQVYETRKGNRVFTPSAEAIMTAANSQLLKANLKRLPRAKARAGAGEVAGSQSFSLQLKELLSKEIQKIKDTVGNSAMSPWTLTAVLKEIEKHEKQIAEFITNQNSVPVTGQIKILGSGLHAVVFDLGNDQVLILSPLGRAVIGAGSLDPDLQELLVRQKGPNPKFGFINQVLDVAVVTSTSEALGKSNDLLLIVSPKLNTEGVTNQHVRELEAKANRNGLNWADPGKDNVGLDPSEQPKIIDFFGLNKRDVRAETRGDGESKAMELIVDPADIKKEKNPKAFWNEAFGEGTFDVEIGSGTGEFLEEWAKQGPVVGMDLPKEELDKFLGREALREALNHRLQRVATMNEVSKNLRIVFADATQEFDRLFPANRLANIFLFFPPLPNLTDETKMETGSGFVNKRFWASLYSRLAPGGTIHFVTESVEYARFVKKFLGGIFPEGAKLDLFKGNEDEVARHLPLSFPRKYVPPFDSESEDEGVVVHFNQVDTHPARAYLTVSKPARSETRSEYTKLGYEKDYRSWIEAVQKEKTIYPALMDQLLGLKTGMTLEQAKKIYIQTLLTYGASETNPARYANLINDPVTFFGNPENYELLNNKLSALFLYMGFGDSGFEKFSDPKKKFEQIRGSAEIVFAFQYLKEQIEAGKTGMENGAFHESASERSEVRERSEASMEGTNVLRLFLPDLSAEEIVDLYILENRGFDRFVEQLWKQSERQREFVRRQVRISFVNLADEMMRQETPEAMLEWLDSETFDRAVENAAAGLAATLKIDQSIIPPAELKGLFQGAASRILILGAATEPVSTAEVLKFGEQAGFSQEAVSLLRWISAKPAHREAVNQAFGKPVFDLNRGAASPNAAVFDLALLDHLPSREEALGQLKPFIRERLGAGGRLAVAIPRGLAGGRIPFRKIYEAGLGQIPYDERAPINVGQLSKKISPGFGDAFLFLRETTPAVVSENFKGSGVFTGPSVLGLSRLSVSDFVRLVETVHRSEFLWEMLEKDPRGPAAFRRLTPQGLSQIAEFFNRLALDPEIRSALARSA